MRIWKPPAFPAILAILLTGCVGHLERPNVPQVITVPAPKGVGNYTLEDYQRDLASYGDGTGANAVALRNKMAYSLMAEIDYAFYDYETKLFLNEGNFRVVSDFLQLGGAAAATVTNGARSKTVISALLTGVTGVDLSIDKNYFRQQTVRPSAAAWRPIATISKRSFCNNSAKTLRCIPCKLRDRI